MQLNADFSQRVAVHAADLPWQASPMPGVHRRMLERIGNEVARATTIVRYQPGSHFSPHVHSGGGEFVVLEGVFEDEHGAYPRGSYVRNPPQTSHTPGSGPGCIMLVKLWQFDPDDRHPVVCNIDEIAAVADPDRPGVAVAALYADSRENVRVEQWASNTVADIETSGGLEILVLKGDFEQAGESFGVDGWLRLPAGEPARLTAGPRGARLWIKSGHLRYAQAPG